MDELARLSQRVKMAKEFSSDDESTDQYFHLFMPSKGIAHVCKHTGHVLLYCRGIYPEISDTWKGCDVQPEHDVIVDDWLYANYHAYRLLNGLLDELVTSNL